MSDWAFENFARIIADAIKYFADTNLEIARQNNETAVKIARIQSGREI